MKKLFAMIATVALALGLCVPAYAAETTGTITIKDAVAGQTYNAYQILDLESYSVDEEGKASGAYSYKASEKWSAFINSTDIDGVYVNVDAQGYVTWSGLTDADTAAFAKLAQAYAVANSIAAEATVVAEGEAGTVATVKFTGLDLGYYLVDTSLGTLCSLDTTNPNVEMEEKNSITVIDKDVKEDANNAWGASNDADIAQTVNFKTTITANKGAQNYVLHDKMSAGLTLDAASISVEGLTKGTQYTVVTEGLEDDCTFHVVFDQAYLDGIDKETDLVVTYSAALNAEAVVGVAGNPNTTMLQYGDNTETSWDQTFTYTWDMKVLKYANGKEADVLADAQFVLLSKDKGKVATVAGGKLTGWVAAPADGKTWPKGTVLTTDASGNIAIAGLDADTYYLHEVKAPAGYNVLAEDVEVVITGATQAEGATELTYTTVVAKVNNQSGTELPSTGGMGTTILYIVGGVLVVGALVLLLARRRAGSEE